MYLLAKPRAVRSDYALFILVISIIMTAFLAVMDGIFSQYGIFSKGAMAIWTRDFQFLFEQGIYAATIFYIGMKFLETRTILSVGFDKIDAHRMSVKGPDEDNIVWVGRRYDSAFEAEAVAVAMARRLDMGDAWKNRDVNFQYEFICSRPQFYYFRRPMNLAITLATSPGARITSMRL